MSDDKGWADGWDPDSVRYAGVPPISDNDQGVCWNTTPAIRRTCIGFEGSIPVLFFGSAHPSGINAVYADASVHFISFDVDHLIFNALGTRWRGNLRRQQAVSECGGGSLVIRVGRAGRSRHSPENEEGYRTKRVPAPGSVEQQELPRNNASGEHRRRSRHRKPHEAGTSLIDDFFARG